MSKRYVIIGLTVILSIAIIYRVSIIFIVPSESSDAFLENKTKAIDLNTLRTKQGVPVIEDNWNIIEYDSNEVFWAFRNKAIYTDTPFHLSKQILYSAGMPTNEVDAFHFNESDTLAYRLLIYSEYQSPNALKRTDNKLLIYYKDKYPPTRSEFLSREKADSLLNVWRISLK